MLLVSKISSSMVSTSSSFLERVASSFSGIDLSLDSADVFSIFEISGIEVLSISSSSSMELVGFDEFLPFSESGFFAVVVVSAKEDSISFSSLSDLA